MIQHEAVKSLEILRDLAPGIVIETGEELIDDVTEDSAREEILKSFKKPMMEELKIPDDKESMAKKPEKKILKKH